MMKRTMCSTFVAAAWLAMAACDDTEAGTTPPNGSPPVVNSGGAGGSDAGPAQPDTAAPMGNEDPIGGEDASTEMVAAADYSVDSHWLCRPGRDDACTQPLDATVVAADGTLTPEPFEPAPEPPIDCFYVYPTVSLDTTPNSDLVPGPEEASVVLAQFARLSSQCRLFAPMYRQVTLTALRSLLTGGSFEGDRALGYQDVLAAWNHYLENDNGGRGVVLIGHSQGAGVLSQLVAEQLDTAPPDSRLLAALLIGTNVLVPPGETVGGTFQNVPVCTSAEELGCVVTYASFRADQPPPATSLFATSDQDGLVAACTNPAALGGGSAPLQAYLSTAGAGASAAMPAPWVTPEVTIETPFVRVPGLLTGECVQGDKGAYLAVTVNGDPADPRVDDIVGDVVTNGEVNFDWGLHLVDVHMAMGDLLELVAAKAQAHAGS